LLTTGNVTTARERLAELLRHAPLGRHLTRPWRVAVAGAPNVGKSSLVNALAGYRRSVVTPVPGTTRDVVSTPLAIDGWSVDLLDTAGQHATADALEGQGIARARATAAAADLCLWVLDATEPPVPHGVISSSGIVVINKIDQPSAWDTSVVVGAVSVSAHTGDGLADLCARISQRLVPDPPAADAGVPFLSALADGLDAVSGLVNAGDAVGAADRVRRLASEPIPSPNGS
jgi:tRNA modification GTPase